MSAIILILVSIVLAGCSKNTDPDVAKTDDANQSALTFDNNNVSTNPPNAPAPIGSNASAAITGNTSTPIAGQAKKPMPSVKQPTAQIGSGGGDLFLFTQVRGALNSDKELLNAVIVEIKEGNVTLTGKVSSEAQKAKAAQLVQSVQGVKTVKNNLRVSS